MLRPLLAIAVLAVSAAPPASAAVVFNDAHLAFPTVETAYSFFNATATSPESNGFRLFADSDRDGQVSEEEADAIEEQFADQAAGSMNGSEDGDALRYDGKTPTSFEIVEIDSQGLVGPTTSNEPIRLYFVARATYDVDASAETHTLYAPIDEEMGNVPTLLTAPPGFVVSSITGLPGASPGGATANGTTSGGEALNATFAKPPKSEGGSNDNVPAPGALLALLAVAGVALARRQRRT